MSTTVTFIWKYKSGACPVNAEPNKEVITTHDFSTWATSESECNDIIQTYLEKNPLTAIPWEFRTSEYYNNTLWQKNTYFYSGYNIDDIDLTEGAVKYTFEATYALLDGPYMVTYNKLFQDAEPYFYGTGTPEAGYFLPDTAEFRVQAAESNNYSEIVKYSGFAVKESKLTAIKKGTFPIISSSHLVATCKYATDLKVKYDHTGKEIESIYIHNQDDIKGKTYTKNDFATNHKLTKLPTTLGFVLVGGGGGAGGITQYDTKKDGSTKNQCALAGGGGGGGEIVWGVIKLDPPKPTKNSKGEYILFEQNLGTTEPIITELDFSIAGYSGGAGGVNGNWDNCSAKKPQYGGNGGNGSATWMNVKVSYKINNGSYSTESIDVVTAYGGKGGSYGVYDGVAAGGAGGTIAHHSTDSFPASSLVVVKRKAGGNGGSVNKDTSISHSSYEEKIYPGTACPTVADCLITINHAVNNGQGKGTAAGGKDNRWKNTANVETPGGHSFGNGGTKYTRPTYGGGGACYRTYDEKWDEKNTGGGSEGEAFGAGAKGFFAIYY